MWRLGVTGGIGSGKSTVCGVFETLGIPVYHADIESRELYYTQDLRTQIVHHFGGNMYEGNELNRKALAARVFSNPEALKLLNSLVHPRVFAHYEQWCDLHSHFPYTVKEAAIVFESSSYTHLHAIAGVVAPLELRVQRVMQRDGVSKEEVMARINNQMPQDRLVSLCDYTIVNDGVESLIKQVSKLHLAIMKRIQSGEVPVFRKPLEP
jgi:dephospho-CoA kinase